MSKAIGLGIAAGVFAVLAGAFALLATTNYNSAMSYQGPMAWGGPEDAAALAAVPSGIAWVCGGAALVCAIVAVVIAQPAPDE